ncbi:MAG: cation diffusion facilitator family transporter [Proteobacteria bacterium]|nr:cation diffusion facilitator family transporter [Pseudomonadota bacterium]
MSAGNSSTRVILFALLANLGIACSKFVGAFVSRSSAMLSEAIHSLVDTTNQVLLLVGSKRAARAPTEKHPLGYGAESFFWSFMVAILLFSLGGMVAVYEGIHKFHSTEPLQNPWVSLAILMVSLVLEALSFRTCLHEIRASNPHGTLWRWFKKTTSAELLVVFTEDLAALLGLVIATGSLLLSWMTSDPRWDAVGSILVGFVLVSVAILLSIEIRSLMIGESPALNYRPFIEERAKELFPGGRVLRFIALSQGGDRVLLSYKIHPGSVQSVSELITRINTLEASVREKYPEISWQFVEPDFEA